MCKWKRLNLRDWQNVSGSWFQRGVDAFRIEWFVIYKEPGWCRARVTTDDGKLLLDGWTEIKLYRQYKLSSCKELVYERKKFVPCMFINFETTHGGKTTVCVGAFTACIFLPRCMECRCGLAMRFLSVRPSVRPSVCLSNACIVTKRKKAMFRFLYHMKEHLS